MDAKIDSICEDVKYIKREMENRKRRPESKIEDRLRGFRELEEWNNRMKKLREKV